MRKLFLTVLLCAGVLPAARAWDPNKPFIYEMRIAFETDNWINMYSTATVLSKSDNTVAFQVVANSTTSPTYQLVVTTQGNVGISTGSPAYKLDVSGSVNAGAYYVNGNLLSSSGSAQWTTSGTSIYYNSGNVGIGATTPGAKLQIANGTNYAVSGINAMLYLTTDLASSVAPAKLVLSGNQAGVTVTNPAVIQVYGQGYTGASTLAANINFITSQGSSGTNVNGNIAFGVSNNGTSPTEAMRIISTGNVGIGTTNPTSMLGIKNSSNRAVDIYTPGTANGTGSNIIWTTDTNGSKQDIAYFGAVQDGDNTQSGKFYWQVGNAGTPGVVMTLNKSGNLGIGTMAPAHRLHLSGGAYCDGTGGWVAGSDRAYKKDIDYGFKYGLREIEKLKPVYYVHKQDTDNRKQIGFIAQDVEKVVPEIVGGSEGSLGLSYERLTAVLVKAVQELELRVDSQRAEIESLKARLREVEKK